MSDNNFKNPDKETVLTPWRVVNMHMSNCLGGWDFFDEQHEEMLDVPRYIEKNKTKEVFRTDTNILEINSKTGLYPLYVTYSTFMSKCSLISKEELTLEKEFELWFETVENNIFVVCKTPMAKTITKRTLTGFYNKKINAHYFNDFLNTMKNKPQFFIDKVLKQSYWKKGNNQMKFDAVVGNPPYQEETVQVLSETNGQAPRKSIFQYFQTAADEVSSGVVSLIYPGARWIHRSGKGMAQFGLEQINDISLEQIDFYPDSKDIFKDVAIADGISIVYKNKKKTESGFTYVYHKDGIETSMHMDNPGEDLIPLNPSDGIILEKISKLVQEQHLSYMHERILPRNLFGIESNFVEINPTKVREYDKNTSFDSNTEVKLFTNDKAGKAGRSKWFVANKDVIENNANMINEWQVVVSSANAGGQKRDNQIEIIDNLSAFGRSRVALASFKTKLEAENFYKYAQTYLIRFMFLMTDESLTSLGKKVPDIMDYSNNNIIDFSADINKQLYALAKLEPQEIAYIENVIKTLR